MKKFFAVLFLVALCVVICVCYTGISIKNLAYAFTGYWTKNEENHYQTEINEEYQSSDTESGFSIKGKWKNVGEGTFGQAQRGSIVIFNGTNCNFFSPRDTYAFYYSGGSYHLDCTSFLFSDTLNFDIKIIDNDNMEVTYKSSTVHLMRVD